ncbi:hypothetical protein [Streptomyces corynorhini]|uniref:Uncharacterized protein n=1 Tax=Streptomyces corynorhini TaxID=2282652 RepID=A0A370B0H4_9ACTN|nr:hypothetical protein [Streptomyces corynorhini]RDG35348.1 hypothetical protein DVH02_25745 [Streptomyces corynorhini]
MTEASYPQTTRTAYDSDAAAVAIAAVDWMAPDRTADRIADPMGGAGLVLDARMIRGTDERARPRQGRPAFFVAHEPETSRG